MPKGPKGETRPGDVIGAAVTAGRIAPGPALNTPHKPHAKEKQPRVGKTGPGRRATTKPRKFSA